MSKIVLIVGKTVERETEEAGNKISIVDWVACGKIGIERGELSGGAVVTQSWSGTKNSNGTDTEPRASQSWLEELVRRSVRLIRATCSIAFVQSQSGTVRFDCFRLSNRKYIVYYFATAFNVPEKAVVSICNRVIVI